MFHFHTENVETYKKAVHEIKRIILYSIFKGWRRKSWKQ